MTKSIAQKDYGGPDAFKEASSDLMATALRSVDIYSLELNRSTFGSDHLSSLLSQWIKSEPKAQVRVFVHEARTAMYRGNPLVELGLRLTSYFEFREPARQVPQLNEMLIVDRRSMLQPSETEAGVVNIWQINSPVVAEALDNFHRYWQDGAPSQNIRNLNL